MLVAFDKIADEARVWIYQANRSFSETELEELHTKLSNFITQWTAHGTDLEASFEIKYKRFIIIAVDQTKQAATGCSIDASVHFIQQLEKEYNVDLMDKMNVSYKQGQYIAYKDLKAFRKMAKDKAVTGNTIVFNNLVATKAEFLENWEVPAKESWHGRFLN
ncbi:ABC transporter ATPase [Kordia algicida OT-1]|uniref:ABC transporter ATPase n=1 Tax=Kordia algicida OT-1 TaxID=391587 RepID=A9DWP0_9FLAO|nr:hypothetical protein [Kordia algicida]EDP95921.1 hypothetical protein KAOT1_07128 [Kordia algicida OT-1]